MSPTPTNPCPYERCDTVHVISIEEGNSKEQRQAAKLRGGKTGHSWCCTKNLNFMSNVIFASKISLSQVNRCIFDIKRNIA